MTKKITELTEDAAPQLGSMLEIVRDPAGTPLSRKSYLYNLLMFTPDGTLLNGKISPTASSNNLVLALKTQAGNDPSAADPVEVKINGSWRSVTAALSLTVTAGTSIFNAGATELATLSLDLFAYLGWRAASSAVVILCSRIPYATLYSDFSGTSTNEKYAAFSTAPAATDDVVNIGRFEATNSGTAAYNWSVPTYTSANLIQRPTFKTRWLTYVPTIVGFSANPTNTIYQYRVDDIEVFVRSRQATAGTSNSTSFSLTAPFTALTLSNAQWQTLGAPTIDNGTTLTTPAVAAIASNSATINITKDSGSAVFTNANSKRVAYFQLQFPISA